MAVSTPEMTKLAASDAVIGVLGPALAARWILRLVAAFAVLAVILFSSAWTFRYWEASAYLLAVVASASVVSFMVLLRNPAIIARRLETPQRSRGQQALVRAFRPLFLVMLFVPGLDHRLGLSRTITGTVPVALALTSDVVIVLGILFYGWVFQVNEYAGQSIRVDKDQRVISDGPYGLVRHPLYAGSLLVWLATPLALGSWIALPLFTLLTPFYVLRAMNEELQLKRELRGYAAYCKRTPFRLIPFVW